MLAALAGGVGAARFLAGLVRVVDPGEVVAIVNTGDDDEFHGLHVSPDLDSVTYTLAGASNVAQGWGLEGETFATLDALARYDVPTWFRLGDKDLATHLFRTQRLHAGAPLSQVTAEIVRGVGPRRAAAPDDRRPRSDAHHRRSRRGHARGTRHAAVVRRRTGRIAGCVGALRRRRAGAGRRPGVLEALETARHDRRSARRTR